VTLQLSTQTVAWLADRPRPRELVGSVWDTLTDLERAGHHPRTIAALRFVLVHHQPPPSPADALTAASPGAACGAADPGHAWSGGKSTTSCSAHSPAAPTTGNDHKNVTGLGAQRDVGGRYRSGTRWADGEKTANASDPPTGLRGERVLTRDERAADHYLSLARRYPRRGASRPLDAATPPTSDIKRISNT
jgi:hypothetical protein